MGSTAAEATNQYDLDTAIDDLAKHKDQWARTEIAERIARDLPVVFVIHGATHMKLENCNILDRVMQNESIRPMQLIDHSKFVRLLANAEMVITDGGSVQEECSYLGVQCLVLRSETERQEGIGGNVRLCKFDKGLIESLLTKNRSSTEYIHTEGNNATFV